jgi:O-antigen/teichoic acid export membrane protein
MEPRELKTDSTAIQAINSDGKIGFNADARTDSFQKRIFLSFAWLAGLKYCGQIITWFITIFVIRLLEPRDYGLMAQAYVFIGFLSLISELGFGTVIVQRKKVTLPLLRTAFGFILLSNGLMFVICYIGAPLVSSFYGEPLLRKIIRVLSYSYLIMSFYALPQSLLYRDMNFRLKGTFELSSAVVSAASTLALAYFGFGLWSLVWGNLALHSTLLLCYTFRCKILYLPRFKLNEFSELISIGGYISGSRILWYFYSQADIIIGGKLLSSQVLGIYSIALKLGYMPLEKLIPLINQVALPAYAKVQDSSQTVRNYFVKSIKLVSFVMFPAYFGLLSTASDIIMLLLESKWEHAILPLQLLAIIMPWRAIGSLYAPVLVGIGRADVSFINVVLSALILPAAFFIGARVDEVRGLCLAWIGGYFIAFIIMSYLTSRKIELRILDLIKSIYPSFISSVVMAGVLIGSRYALFPFLNPLQAFGACIFIGVVIYLSVFFVLNKRGLLEIYGAVSPILHKSCN